jgi:hypothetical protein
MSISFCIKLVFQQLKNCQLFKRSYKQGLSKNFKIQFLNINKKKFYLLFKTILFFDEIIITDK